MVPGTCCSLTNKFHHMVKWRRTKMLLLSAIRLMIRLIELGNYESTRAMLILLLNFLP